MQQSCLEINESNFIQKCYNLKVVNINTLYFTILE